MKNIIEQAFRQYVSGVADLNEKGEVKINDRFREDLFIAFPNNSLEYVVVRRYWWGNGQKYWEKECRSGKLHGKSLYWYYNGQKRWEKEYRNGQLHGKSLYWYSNGQKRWEKEYQNGQLHGKDLGWYYNGQGEWEREYRNGELVYEKHY